MQQAFELFNVVRNSHNYFIGQLTNHFTRIRILHRDHRRTHCFIHMEI